MTLKTHTNNYVLGRGEVSVALLSALGVPMGFRFKGNTPGFNLSVTTEKKAHFSSSSGIRKKDKEVTVSTDFSGTITCDDVSAENLEALFAGVTETVTQTGTPVTNERMGGHSAVTGNKQAIRADREYQVGYHATNNHTGVRKISAVTVKSFDGVNAPARANTTAYALGATIKVGTDWYIATVAGTSAASAPAFNTAVGQTTTDGGVTWTSMGTVNAYTVDVDYKLDTAIGRLYVMPTGAIASYLAAIPNGADGNPILESSLNLDYTPAAGTRKRMKSGAGGQILVALHYKADNASGDNRDVLIPSCTLSPDGDIPFITGEDWAEFTFSIGVNEKDSSTSLVYIDGRQL